MSVQNAPAPTHKRLYHHIEDNTRERLIMQIQKVRPSADRRHPDLHTQNRCRAQPQLLNGEDHHQHLQEGGTDAEEGHARESQALLQPPQLPQGAGGLLRLPQIPEQDNGQLREEGGCAASLSTGAC
jgi:hypothetical protein